MFEYEKNAIVVEYYACVSITKSDRLLLVIIAVRFYVNNAFFKRV